MIQNLLWNTDMNLNIGTGNGFVITWAYVDPPTENQKACSWAPHKIWLYNKIFIIQSKILWHFDIDNIVETST